MADAKTKDSEDLTAKAGEALQNLETDESAPDWQVRRERLDAIADAMFGRPYDQLSNVEQQQVAADGNLAASPQNPSGFAGTDASQTAPDEPKSEEKASSSS